MRIENFIHTIYSGNSGGAAKLNQLEEIKRRNRSTSNEDHFYELTDFLELVQEDIRIKESINSESGVKSSKGTHSNFRLGFYFLLGITFTYLNFSIPYLLSRINWKEIIWLQIAILIAVPVFYFRNVPGWVQFLVGTLLAILAIITDL